MTQQVKKTYLWLTGRINTSETSFDSLNNEFCRSLLFPGCTVHDFGHYFGHVE